MRIGEAHRCGALIAKPRIDGALPLEVIPNDLRPRWQNLHTTEKER
jgi:hypothetical protein